MIDGSQGTTETARMTTGRPRTLDSRRDAELARRREEMREKLRPSIVAFLVAREFAEMDARKRRARR